MIGGNSHELLSLPTEGTDRAATRKERFGQEYKKGNNRRNQVMKKLLTILALVLALCMLTGMALAEDSELHEDELKRIQDLYNEAVNPATRTVIKEATCLERGIVQYQCTQDPKQFHETFIEKLPHDFDEDTEIKYYADDDTFEVDWDNQTVVGTEIAAEDYNACTDYKVIWTTRVCSLEEEPAEGEEDTRTTENSFEVVDPLGHEWEDGDSYDLPNWGKYFDEADKPTCCEWGIRYDYCLRCGAKNDGWWKDVPPTEKHNFTILLPEQQPTCLNGFTATYYKQCSNARKDGSGICGFVQEDAEGWKLYTDKKLSLTSVNALWPIADYYDIEDDDPNYPTYRDAKGHVWTYLGVDETDEDAEYKCVGTRDVWGCLNCAEKKYDVVNPEEKFDPSKTPAAGHYTLIVERVDCTHNKETKICVNCEGKVNGHKVEKIVELDEDDLTNHIFERTGEYVAPTCTENGTISWKCAECGLEETTTYWAPGHAWTEWVLRAESNNYKYYLRECQVCHTTEELITKNEPENEAWVLEERGEATCTDDAYDVYSHYDEASGETWWKFVFVSERLGHDTETIEKAPTCTEPGTKMVFCKRCEQILENTAYLPALGHTTIEEGKVTKEAKAATCTEEGYTAEISCGRCDVVLQESEAIEKVAHVWKEYPAKEATCTEEGYHAYIQCENCPAYKPGFEKVTIAKKAHTPGEYVTVEATCTKEGSKTTKCTVCGEDIVETIPALGHDIVIDAAVAATCTADGKTEGKHCTRCDEATVAQEVVKALGHDVVKVEAKAATCTEDGNTAGQKCSRCDDVTIAVEVIPALGHDWTEWEETKPAAIGEKGEKVRKCNRCDAEETEEIPALPVPAKYVLKDVKFENNLLTGKIEHVEGTEFSEKLGVRVTFFIEGNMYMVTAATIYEDGTFEAMGAGAIEHVTVAAYNTNRVVNPQDLGTATWFGSEEFDAD